MATVESVELELSRFWAIWNQANIPVMWKQKSGLLMRMPYFNNNREWLRNGKRNDIAWDRNDKCWDLPKSWFHAILTRSLSRFERTYVIQSYNKLEKCAPACWGAKHADCECSCLGANHGSHCPGSSWYEISETLAIRYSTQPLSCRLLVVPASKYSVKRSAHRLDHRPEVQAHKAADAAH